MKKVLSQLIDSAILHIKLNDSLLITKGQERALAARLAFYLSKELSGWDVDCEYNRQEKNGDPKATAAGKAKRPDVIIHHRGLLDKDNLPYIEVKIMNKNVLKDEEKLKEFTSFPSGQRRFQYQFGLSLSFMPNIVKTWYSEGSQLSW